MITLDQLSKTFGEKSVLKSISFSFEKGKCYGIVGENGAGKTTLFRCITGLEKYEGKIESTFHPLKNYIGYLQTESFYFQKMTGKEYIQFFLQAKKKKISDIESQNIFDLPLNQYVSSYSTGMKKKLSIMATILQGNEIFIFDEPYNGVDIHSNILITEIIRKLQSKGKTILISSHIFSTLTEICDSICFLKNGKFEIVADKNEFYKIEELMKNEYILQKLNQLKI